MAVVNGVATQAQVMAALKECCAVGEAYHNGNCTYLQYMAAEHTYKVYAISHQTNQAVILITHIEPS